MKRAKPKFVTIRRHEQVVGGLQDQIEMLQSIAKLAGQERERDLSSLRKTIDFTDELSRKSRDKFKEMTAELADVKQRLDRIEPFILACLDAEQRDFAKTLGISSVEYGIQYLRLLHENRHIIHAARNLQ